MHHHIRKSTLLTLGLTVVFTWILVGCGGGSSKTSSSAGLGGVSSYSVGGTVSGLSGSLVLQNNGADNLTVTANGSFTFITPLLNSGAYKITVLSNPTDQTCAVNSGTGVIVGSNVSSVTVTCSSQNVSSSPSTSTPSSKVSESATLALFAGSLGWPNKAADGMGTAAGFYGPSGVATDSTGNVYVADRGNHTIRKITPAGVVSTLAGTAGVKGSADGIGAAASFNRPFGVATDNAGNVYVADSDNNIIRKITPAGVVSTLAGTAGVSGSADGIGAAASFDWSSGVATDSAGNVYVADRGNHTIRKITPAGVVSTLAGTAGVKGSADGIGAAASFNWPSGVATDNAGNVYVADSDNNIIRKITPVGVVSTLAGTAGVKGSADGIGAAASFIWPSGVATDSAGNVYVADKGNNTIRKITPAGVVSTLAGRAGVQGSTNGIGAAASFNGPTGIATDSVGNVYVASYDIVPVLGSGFSISLVPGINDYNNAIRKITPAGVVSILAGSTGSQDGAGVAAGFNNPEGVTTDSAGNVYVADRGNNTIRMITPAGVVTTLAGTAGTIGSADGTGAAASFFEPSGVAADSAGNVYVADRGNHTIRKITPAGVVSTLAGTADALSDSADGTGAAARFIYLTGIATDSEGNVYVVDSVTIRKITPAGVTTTLAGAASFSRPSGIATDSAGNVYVADSDNNIIRKITPAGVMSTLAGTAGVKGSADGIGAAARFDWPSGVATDSAGNIYVADKNNLTIRKITPSGVVTTVVGMAGNSGFVSGTLSSVLLSSKGIAIHGTSIYISTKDGVAVVTNVP